MPGLISHLVDLWYMVRGRPRFNLQRERKRLFPELDNDTDIEGMMWYDQETGSAIIPFWPRQRATPRDGLSRSQLARLWEASRAAPVFYSSDEEDDDEFHINPPVSSTSSATAVAADSDDVSSLDLNV